ncbi:hypothetical protein BGZ65_002301, partial [Modicella reniformis]
MSDFQRGLQAFERLVKSDEGVRAGSCRKCGGSGHLTYECRNNIKLDQMPAEKSKSSMSSRFGFLKKQFGSASSTSPSPSATGAVTGASIPTKDRQGSGSAHKAELSSGGKKKKRRGSSDSNGDNTSSEFSDSYSDSEDDRR